MGETKKCPMCAETIPADAVFCPYCGTRFGEGGQVTPPAAPALRTAASATPVPTAAKKNRWLGWVVAAVLCVVLVIAGFLIIQNRFRLPAYISPATATPVPLATSTPQPPTATATPVVLTGTLTLWHSFSPGTSEENALLAVIQNAEAENPGLHVIISYHAYEPSNDEYTSAVSTGGVPDIILTWNENLGDMVRAGVVLDLQGYATEDRLAGMKQYALEGLTIDGKLYGLPETSNIVALYYNKILVPNPPATTDELLSLIRNGKKMDMVGYTYWFHGFWSSFGVQIQDESGRCNAAQSGFVPAVQYILDLKNAGVDQVEYEEAQNNFTQKRTGMLINGSWALADYKEILGDNLGVSVLPSGPAGPSKPITGVSGFFINPKSDKPEVAFLLIHYMTNRASAKIFTEQAGHIPVRDDVTISDTLLSTFSMAASLGTSRAENKLFDNYWDPFNQMFNDVLSGAATPQVAIQRACESMNALNGLP